MLFWDRVIKKIDENFWIVILIIGIGLFSWFGFKIVRFGILGDTAVITNHNEDHSLMQDLTPRMLDVLLQDASKHKSIAVALHSSWCPRCRKIMPDVFRTINHSRVKDLYVLSIYVDASKKSAEKLANNMPNLNVVSYRLPPERIQEFFPIMQKHHLMQQSAMHNKRNSIALPLIFISHDNAKRYTMFSGKMVTIASIHDTLRSGLLDSNGK